MLLIKILNVMVLLGFSFALPKRIDLVVTDPTISQIRVITSGRRTKSEST
jgi:hypothetical protein